MTQAGEIQLSIDIRRLPFNQMGLGRVSLQNEDSLRGKSVALGCRCGSYGLAISKRYSCEQYRRRYGGGQRSEVASGDRVIFSLLEAATA